MVLGVQQAASKDRNWPAVSRAAPDRIEANYLFESIVCDLHLSAVQIGVIACLLNAHAKIGSQGTLQAWRRLSNDNTKIVRLSLKNCAEIGVGADAGAKINAMYDRLSAAIAPTRALMISEEITGDARREALAKLAATWRRLAQHAIDALNGVAPDAKRRLVDKYSADNKILVRFLNEALSGDARRVSGTGEICVPDLNQLRRSPRVAVRWPCHLSVAGETAPAMLVDVAVNGVGVACKHPLEVGQAVTIELEDARRLEARVAWRTGDRAGLRLATSLAIDDALLKA